MMERLAQFTDIRCYIVIGGVSNKLQEVELRKKPDVVVATPGRMIDHLRNSPGVGIEGLEILVLDEADRLLEMGFTEEVQEVRLRLAHSPCHARCAGTPRCDAAQSVAHYPTSRPDPLRYFLFQVVKMCPIARQTMLFSATMTHDVDQLAAYSLKRPVRVTADGSIRSEADGGSLNKVAVPAKLQQEFVRIRKARGKWLRFCIAHPGIPDEDGQVMPPFEGRERIKSNDYQFFLGDCIWEPTHNKVGRWQLSTWIEDELVADQKFMVQVPQPEAKESPRPSPYKDPQRQF